MARFCFAIMLGWWSFALLPLRFVPAKLDTLFLELITCYQKCLYPAGYFLCGRVLFKHSCLLRFLSREQGILGYQQSIPFHVYKLTFSLDITMTDTNHCDFWSDGSS